MGQRTNFGDVGRNTPALPEGSGAQCPSHEDCDLHILHPTTRVPPSPWRTSRGSAAAGPTSAARMRRLFSSVQRSERTPGCARSSSAAASTQTTVQTTSARLPHRQRRPHRPHRPHCPGRPRAPAVCAMTSARHTEPCTPVAAPRLPAQRGRGCGGEATRREGRPRGWIPCPASPGVGDGVRWLFPGACMLDAPLHRNTRTPFPLVLHLSPQISSALKQNPRKFKLPV